MPFTLGMLMNMFFGKAGKEDAVEAGMESVEVGTAHVADTRLGLAFSGLCRTAPHKTLIDHPQVLLPVVHFKAADMGAACRTHGSHSIRLVKVLTTAVKDPHGSPQTRHSEPVRGAG